jgi:hypothetical protein
VEGFGYVFAEDTATEAGHFSEASV